MHSVSFALYLLLKYKNTTDICHFILSPVIFHIENNFRIFLKEFWDYNI